MGGCTVCRMYSYYRLIPVRADRSVYVVEQKEKKKMAAHHGDAHLFFYLFT